MLKVVRTVPEEKMDDYEAARQSYTDIRQRLTDIEADISRLEAGGGPLDAAAEAYLANPSQAASFQSELERLGTERAVVERAVDIARQKLNAARVTRDNDFVKSLRPLHREAAARVATCLIQLGEANAEEVHIRQRAPGGALPFLSFPGVDLGRPDTQAKYFLRYLKDNYDIEPVARTEAAL